MGGAIRAPPPPLHRTHRQSPLTGKRGASYLYDSVFLCATVLPPVMATASLPPLHPALCPHALTNILTTLPWPPSPGPPTCPLQFFLQGDRERLLGLPISPLFDRTMQGVTKSQVGFFDIVGEQLLWAVTCEQGVTKSRVGSSTLLVSNCTLSELILAHPLSSGRLGSRPDHGHDPAAPARIP